VHRTTTSKPPSRSQKKGIVVTLIVVGVAAPLAAISPWVLSAFLILGCAIYVAFEFALVKVPMRRLERDAAGGKAGAALLLDMTRCSPRVSSGSR
jgi:hypothetical protein